MSLTVTLSHDASVFARLQSEWEALQAESRADGIYLTWDWITLWWEHFGGEGELWLLEARTESGELVGIGPMMLVAAVPFPGVRWRQLQFIGTSTTCEYLDFLSQPGYEEAVLHAFLDRFKAEQPRWDVIRLAQLPEDSLTLALLQDEHDIPWEQANRLVAPVIQLPDDWETYFRDYVSRRKRKVQRRYRRDLDEHYPDGGWRYVRVTDPEQLTAALDELIHLHQDFWTAQGEPGAFAGDREAFFRQVAQRFLERDWLELSRLEIGDRLAVSFLAYRYRNRLYDFAGGMDPEFDEYQPGHVLVESVLRYVIDRGVNEYDFLWGDEQYKYRWGAEDRQHITLRWIASPRARFEHNVLEGLRAGWKRVKGVMPHSVRVRLKQAVNAPSEDE